jgi:hypothetical protein
MKTYQYRLTDPCEICGKRPKNVILSINPNKRTLSPFSPNDLVPLSCGHMVPAKDRKVSPVNEKEHSYA